MILMILSHGFRLLVEPHQEELALNSPGSFSWLVMLATKSAAPLFMLCFGYTLSLIYPRISWAQARHLGFRALLVWLSYKALLGLELLYKGASWRHYQLALESQILSQHAEILDFYVWALLAAPALMWAWQRINWPLRVAAVLVPWACGSWLAGQDWQPGDLDLTLARWVLVGDRQIPTFPLLQWSATVGLGLCLGSAPQKSITRLCLLLSALLLTTYAGAGQGHILANLNYVATQQWKRPPTVAYIALTTAWALLWLAWMVARQGQVRSQPGQHPLEVMGRRSLLQFNLHFPLIFCLHSLAPQGLDIAPSWLASLLVVLACYLACAGLDHRHRSPEPPPGWLTNSALAAGAIMAFLGISRALSDRRYHIHIEGLLQPGTDWRVNLWLPDTGWRIRYDGSLWSKLPDGNWLRLCRTGRTQAIRDSAGRYTLDLRVSLPRAPRKVTLYFFVAGYKTQSEALSLKLRKGVWQGQASPQLQGATTVVVEGDNQE